MFQVQCGHEKFKHLKTCKLIFFLDLLFRFGSISVFFEFKGKQQGIKGVLYDS